MPYYAVAKGRQIGIYTTWTECKEMINGYSQAIFKKFDTKNEAEIFIINNSEEVKEVVTVVKPLKIKGTMTETSKNAFSILMNSNEEFIPDYYVYTDGACSNNGYARAVAGIGIYFGENDPRNLSMRIDGKQTNNTAELGAFLHLYKIIESDLSILKYLAQQVEKNVPEFKAFAPVLIIQEFERGLIKELDFKIEARHLEKFAKNFVGWDQIHIPKVYRELSTDNILVMEKIPGVKITMAKEKYPNLDMNQIAELSVEMLFKQVFEDGLFHGDLHPGNLLVAEDGKLGLIDFGLVGRLSPQMRDILADLLMQITMKNDEMVARIIYEMSANGADIDYHAWERDISELMDKHFSNSSLADVDFGGIVKDLIDGAIAHQVSIPSEYTMFFKAVMTVEGIGKIVSPELDLLATCQPFVEKLIRSRYEPDRLMQEGVELLYALTRSSKRLPKVMNRLVEKIEDRKFAVRIDDQDLKLKLQIKQKFANRQILVYIATVFLAFAVYLTEKPDLSANMILLDKILYLLAFGILSHVLWKSFWEDY